MDISTVLGIAAGFTLIFLAIGGGGGKVVDFFDISAVLIVVGGTISATIISNPFDKVKKTISVIMIGIKAKKKLDISDRIKEIISLAHVARKNGLLALEAFAEECESKFFEKALLLIVDGGDPARVKEILEMEIINMERRHKEGQDILLSMGKYAPAFGMTGTVIGLIKMLKNLSDSATLGPAMAIALVTTFYGVLLANLLFNPFAAKLKSKTQQDVMEMELIVEGVLSIQAGEAPYYIEEKLRSYVELNKRKKEDK